MKKNKKVTCPVKNKRLVVYVAILMYPHKQLIALPLDTTIHEHNLHP